MRVDVVMPQMGESIAEGTITRWIKKAGETVQRDEPLFEISTDKVDAEIPSPAAGTLLEIRHAEGTTVPVNEIVGLIETDATAARSAPAPEKAASAPQQPARPAAPAAPPQPAVPAAVPRTAAPPAPKPADAPRLEAFVSPVVRRMADEHGIDPASVPGTGAGGRVTKKDLLTYLATGGSAEQAAVSEAPPAPPAVPAEGRAERVPMTAMRKKIAEHMVASRRTSAHVHSIFEADMSRVVRLREGHQEAYERRQGAKLTYMPFFIKASCDALRAFPIVNASVEGEEIVYHKDLNIGIAVALDWGLIVPVIRNADELSIVGLARKVADLADRARSKKLNPDEVHGGTFTITNFGMYGGIVGLPIINQPQVAILGTGGIQKRPVVVDDAIAIRPMMYLALSFDHRVVDGAVADQFLAALKRSLESFDESLL